MDVTLPTLGESKSTGVVLKVLVSEGDTVEEDQPLAEIETDKATAEVPAPRAGTVMEVAVSRGDEVRSGDLIVTLDVEEDEASEDETSGERSPEEADDPDDEGDEARAPEPDRSPRDRPSADGSAGDASPAVRKLARELGVEDMSRVAATGRQGVVTLEDLKSHVRHALREPEDRDEDASASLPDLSRWGDVERRPLSPLRRAIANNVSRAWREIPHVTQGDEADVTELSDALDAIAARHDRSVSPTAVLVAVTGRALRRFEALRSAIDLDAGERVVRDYVHVGVAVDTERGLLVPVVRDADRRGLVEIAEEVERLAEDARAGALDREQMQGATFTVTNLGGLGTTTFTPIVAWPQVGILGVGRMAPRAVPDGAGGFTARTLLPLSLSYDHRAIDGADAARFLRWIARALESPLTLIA